MTEADMLARIDVLQKENAALKTSKSMGGVNISYGSYKGKPTMELSGTCAPLRFGKAKARAIVACIDEIKRFAEEQ